MRKSIYPSLAIDGIRKNSRIYIPYLLMNILMVGVFSIITQLSLSNVLGGMPGSESLADILAFGRIVMAVFSAIFLFYANSFLIRRRMKEYGLYNILGMGKRAIRRLVLVEQAITYISTTAAGIILGIGTSKIFEMILTRMISGTVSYRFEVHAETLVYAAVFFGIINMIISLNAIRILGKAKPVELLRSENAGEKPPRANYFTSLAGIALLGWAYYLAVAIEQPIEAFTLFFAAVLMVIIGTYLVFVAASVALCRILQKNKGYYYNRKHFVHVSQMAYRMKRNGAGLASVCILMTMVLVTMTTTVSLYAGKTDCLSNQYPMDQNTSWSEMGYHGEGSSTGIDNLDSELTGRIQDVSEKHDVQPKDLRHYAEYTITGMLEGDEIKPDMEFYEDAFVDYSRLCEVHFIDIEDYNRMSGRALSLKPGEAAVLSIKAGEDRDTVRIGDVSVKIKEYLPAGSLDLVGAGGGSMTCAMFVFARDMNELVEPLKEFKDIKGRPMLMHYWHMDYDYGRELSDEEAKILSDDISSVLNQYEGYMSNSSSRQIERADFISIFGGMLMLGILLSGVFAMSAVLIIYYKQVSEGFEDQKRFEIMRKVGMTDRDIRQSISSQMLLLMMLPILMACMHMCFAFPFLNKILMMFGLFNLKLMIAVSAGCALAFVLIYVAAYRWTSNAYYRLVTTD